HDRLRDAAEAVAVLFAGEEAAELVVLRRLHGHAPGGFLVVVVAVGQAALVGCVEQRAVGGVPVVPRVVIGGRPVPPASEPPDAVLLQRAADTAAEVVPLLDERRRGLAARAQRVVEVAALHASTTRCARAARPRRRSSRSG